MTKWTDEVNDGTPVDSPESRFRERDEEWMRIALEEAARAEALPKVLMAMGDFPGVLDHLDAARRHIAESPDPADVADPALRWLAAPQDDLTRLLGWAVISAAHARRPDLFVPLTAELDEA